MIMRNSTLFLDGFLPKKTEKKVYMITTIMIMIIVKITIIILIIIILIIIMIIIIILIIIIIITILAVIIKCNAMEMRCLRSMCGVTRTD